jgi:hypothetical protein
MATNDRNWKILGGCICSRVVDQVGPQTFLNVQRWHDGFRSGMLAIHALRAKPAAKDERRALARRLAQIEAKYSSKSGATEDERQEAAVICQQLYPA